MKDRISKAQEKKKLGNYYDPTKKGWVTKEETEGDLGSLIPAGEYDASDTPEARALKRDEEIDLATRKADIQAQKEKDVIDYRLTEEGV